jgi:Nucleotidyl transferase AbiEii toxin, Type IV TA system
VKRASKDTLAGRRYLDLQRQAKRSGRPTDELIQLYALECFLDRLVHSEFADTFILKGGVLLAALDARRPTRDIDFAVRVFENSAEKVLSAVRTIAAIPLDDGMTFDSSGAAAEAIREEDSYSGIRVTLGGTLSRAVVRFVGRLPSRDSYSLIPTTGKVCKTSLSAWEKHHPTCAKWLKRAGRMWYPGSIRSTGRLVYRDCRSRSKLSHCKTADFVESES